MYVELMHAFYESVLTINQAVVGLTLFFFPIEKFFNRLYKKPRELTIPQQVLLLQMGNSQKL